MVAGADVHLPMILNIQHKLQTKLFHVLEWQSPDLNPFDNLWQDFRAGAVL